MERKKERSLQLMFRRCQEYLDRFYNWGKILEIKSEELTLHFINVAEINAQQN